MYYSFHRFPFSNMHRGLTWRNIPFTRPSKHRADRGFTNRDDAWRRGRGVKGCVTSRTSHLRQGLVRESWTIALVFRRSFLHIRISLYYAYCCKCVKSYKNLRCVRNSYRFASYTTDCKGGLEVCDVILGVLSRVTKRDEEGRGGYFFSKIAWRHLWTTP